jgi:pyruvate/2-oxoglutarate/acetoin dehydrogenase E1 component
LGGYGNIGGVNQSLEGLQKKYGELRITDTGIREHNPRSGNRPGPERYATIAEIQYLDYLMYALQILSDDLAPLITGLLEKWLHH